MTGKTFTFSKLINIVLIFEFQFDRGSWKIYYANSKVVDVVTAPEVDVEESIAYRRDNIAWPYPFTVWAPLVDIVSDQLSTSIDNNSTNINNNDNSNNNNDDINNDKTGLTL